MCKAQKKMSMVLAVVLALVFCLPVQADERRTAESGGGLAVYLEEDLLETPIYLIDGEPYAPVSFFFQDLGYTVDFDSEAKAVMIDWEWDFEAEDLAYFFEFVQAPEREVLPSPHVLTIFEEPTDYKMVSIDGYNFAALEDLADVFGYRYILQENQVVFTSDPFYDIDKITLQKYWDYFQASKIPVDLTDTESLKHMDFSEYNVFFVGENHAVHVNKEIQLFFIQFLYENYGVRHIITEGGYCDTILENRFLETGDLSIIDKIVSGNKGSYAYTREDYDYYIALYEYNQTLPENEKLVISGIDVQHNQRGGLKTLCELLESKNPTDAIILADLEMLSQEDFGIDDLMQVMLHMAVYEDAYRECLGDDFFPLMMGLRSIVQSILFYEESDYDLRESSIHENFEYLFRHLEMEKCFGMFGGAHTMLDGAMEEQKNLAHFLNTDFDQTENKVLSIMVDYYNCSYMSRNTGEALPLTPNYSKTLSAIMAEASPADCVLIPVDETVFTEDTLAASFQYFLNVQDSPAATPYGDLQ